MKRLCKKDSKKTSTKWSGLSRKGVASLYIVIFATILFGVVTLSFMRIVLSEAGQGTDDDLSRSAYDAAIAGVEDAKTAVNRYYQCLDENGDFSNCNGAVLFKQDCDNDGIGLARYLYGYTGGEVLIQQSDLSAGEGVNNNSDQAYTCVIISDTVPDYRGTLTSDTRTKVIPIGVSTVGSGSGLSDVKRVSFKWYSQLNVGNTEEDQLRFSSNGQLQEKGERTIPPTVSLTLIHVGPDSNIRNIDDFYRANSSEDYATVILLPDGPSTAGSTTEIKSSDLRNAGNVNNDGITGKHPPVGVKCSTTTEFACSVDLTELSFSNRDSAFLVVSLPYGDTITDFAVTLYDSHDNAQELTGVQISVDSTGRTNDLVRRVEVRLDPADLFFPYPQYALELDGSSEDSKLSKTFWVTANCWWSRPTDGGTAQQCENYGIWTGNPMLDINLNTPFFIN